MKFFFSDETYKLGIRGSYFSILGMRNRPSTDEEVQSVVAELISHLSENASVSAEASGFGELHAKVSTRPDKLKASPLGLLQFFVAHGDIPRINGIVDVYNAISLKTMLAVGAHNRKQVEGDVTLRLANGSEAFWPLGAKKRAKTVAGEYAYIDDANDILCRLEVRQVEKTKITIDTTDIFYIVQGHHQFPDNAIEDGARELADKSIALFGGELVHHYP